MFNTSSGMIVVCKYSPYQVLLMSLLGTWALIAKNLQDGCLRMKIDWDALAFKLLQCPRAPEFCLIHAIDDESRDAVGGLQHAPESGAAIVDMVIHSPVAESGVQMVVPQSRYLNPLGCH